jgi:hypothetical protein
MIHLRKRSMVSYFITPLFLILLLFGLFSIVWLRSNFVSAEYTISELENKRMEMLRETKMLMAEKSMLLSMQKVEKTAVRNLGLVFPDRKKVLYVKGTEMGPQKASFTIPSTYSYGRTPTGR